MSVLAVVAVVQLASRSGPRGSLPLSARSGVNAASTVPSGIAHGTSSAAATAASAAERARVRSGTTARLAGQPWLTPVSAAARGYLRLGSEPSALPADLLIVDKLNNRLIVVDPQGRIRWQFPRPGDLPRGATFLVPDDAFFTPDGAQIVATQEDQSVVTIIDVRTHRIVYRYGVPGQPGSTPNHLSNPDDAMALPNGNLVVADIKNCRILIIARGSHAPLQTIGMTTTSCRHAPPRHWGSPNGVFPMRGTRFLVTEINGDWVTEIGLDGTVYWSAHPPGVGYPSDSNMIGPDRFLTVDYASPGQVVIFDRAGNPLWRWRGSGTDMLNHPSLALPLPNGDVVVNDDFNHRVVVVDPRTDKIVWQYGVTGVAGSDPGLLDNPDGLDFVPPRSFLTTH